MENGIRIINSQIVFSYRRNLNIRRRIFEFEDVLNNKFRVPFRPVTIPDDIEPNIPRFEAQSIHGHSKLQVSQTSITLATSFDDQFKSDSSKIQSYLTDKYESLKGLAETEGVEFIAYIVELGVFKDSEELNSYLKENTGALAIGQDCKDFSLLYSRGYQQNYYLNVKISKFTEEQLTIHPETGGLRPTGRVNHGISIIIDFNSRPYFEKNQRFDSSLHSDIREKIFELINNKSIKDYLRGEL